MDEDTAAQIKWFRRVLDTASKDGFTRAVALMSLPDLVFALQAAIQNLEERK